MAFAVIAIHTHALQNYSNLTSVRILNFAIWSAVPYFFMSSGYLIGAKEKDDDSVKQGVNLFVVQIKKYLLVYCIGTILYLPLSYKAYVWPDFPRAICRFALDFLFLGQHKDDWILWYLLAAVYGFSLMWLLAQIDVKPITILFVVIIITVCSYGVESFYLSNSNELSYVTKKIYDLINATTQGGRVFRGMIFIPIGYVLGKYNKKEHLRLDSLVTSILGMIITTVGGLFTYDSFSQNIIYSFYAIFLFMFVISINEIFAPILNTWALREYSKAIYFIHMYVFVVSCDLIWGSRKFGIIPFLITSILTIVLSSPYVFLKKYKKKKQKFEV